MSLFVFNRDKMVEALDADMIVSLRQHFNQEKQYEAEIDSTRLGEAVGTVICTSSSLFLSVRGARREP